MKKRKTEKITIEARHDCPKPAEHRHSCATCPDCNNLAESSKLHVMANHTCTHGHFNGCPDCIRYAEAYAAAHPVMKREAYIPIWLVIFLTLFGGASASLGFYEGSQNEMLAQANFRKAAVEHPLIWEDISDPGRFKKRCRNAWRILNQDKTRGQLAFDILDGKYDHAQNFR